MKTRDLLPLIAVCFLCGCRVAELGEVDSRNYFVFEDGHQRQFHAVQIWTHTSPPIGPQTARRYVLLILRTPNHTSSSLVRAIDATPPWRAIEGSNDGDLFHLVECLTSDEPPDAPRWIVSIHDPLVVAIGTDAGPFEKMGGAEVIDGLLHIGMSQHLISDGDWGRGVSRLIVLDHWLNVGAGTPCDRAVEARRRIIELSTPMTLREAVDQRVWLRPAGESPASSGPVAADLK